MAEQPPRRFKQRLGAIMRRTRAAIAIDSDYSAWQPRWKFSLQIVNSHEKSGATGEAVDQDRTAARLRGTFLMEADRAISTLIDRNY